MDMCRTDLEDEVMTLRAQNQNLFLAYRDAQKELLEKDNEMMSLRRQLAALTCACCDPEDFATNPCNICNSPPGVVCAHDEFSLGLGALVDAGAPPDESLVPSRHQDGWGKDPW